MITNPDNYTVSNHKMTLNYDCINKIMDYVHDLEHTGRYNNVLKQVSYRAARIKIDRICKHQINQYFIPAKFSDELGLVDAILFEDLIRVNSNKDERTWFMREMSNCKCCEKHQQNKPTLSDYLNGHPGNYPENNSIDETCHCSCKCRSFARFLCRIDNAPPLDTEDQMVGLVDDLIIDDELHT